ncbi:N-acetylglucosaminyldiphosphodolichol N-acetylglucosaminyltransferase catalytic subunit alg13 [Neocucurbitaria cava]|uniref:UDP-N-acetylglucosamine transferase subunit ALG13 n=1 Tax=Neocucurbitaria cava TaxID=798079 RepID=A0A9W8Y9L3_9PLEO|nr:N-acetylglucosaminyldiphosphodolichol N-acetylglucosaminyltransferase catalytic subunit alg13 [Neocucurbitaria cava]
MAESWKLPPGSKLCFVTTGATAPFTALIESALSPSSLQALRECGFTNILVQYGTAKDVFARCSSAAVSHLENNGLGKELSIAGFDFDSNALQPQFKLVQKTKGLVVSHAGSGTILAALRYQIPLVVVPNTGLLDNHQEELAVAMERNRYLLRGDVQDLAPAITKSEDFRVKMSQFPPVTSGEHRDTKSFNAIMDETLGFMD